MQQITSAEAPQASNILSQAIVSNGTVYVSGQIHQNADGSLYIGTVAERIDKIMKNISSILAASGSSMEKVVKVTIYTTNLAQLEEINEFYPKYFSTLPAREAIGVSALPLGASIEISVIAEAQSQ